jgi:nicotinamidase-related amidase
MNTALLIIDLEEDFFHDNSLSQDRKELVNSTNELIKKCRMSKISIIWIKQEFQNDLSDAPLAMRKGLIPKITISGTSGANILPELDRQPNDELIIKTRYSGFFKTNLEDTLEKHSIKRLIVAGINTHACVRMTIVDAYQRDYEVIVATDCVDSYDKEHHQVTLRYLTNVMSQGKTNQEIKSLLELK